MPECLQEESSPGWLSVESLCVFLIGEGRQHAGHTQGLLGSKQELIQGWSGPEILPFNKLPGDTDAAGTLDHSWNRKGLTQGLGARSCPRGVLYGL